MLEEDRKLFAPDEIPPATLPTRAAPPSRAQDMLEQLRFNRERLKTLEVQRDAEVELSFELERSLKSTLRVGETVRVFGAVAVRRRGALDITWAK